MQQRHKIYLLFHLLFIPFLAIGQKNVPYFNRLTNEEGLNQNTIITLHQDEFGFIWMGSPNGLIRYDGNEFKSYVHEPGDETSLLNSYVYLIHNDKNGNLWLGTNAGLCIYSIDDNSFTEIKEMNAFLSKSNVIEKIIDVDDNTKWILARGGLYQLTLKNGVYTVKELEVEKSNKRVKGYYVDLIQVNSTYYFLTHKSIIVSRKSENGSFHVKEVHDIMKYDDYFCSNMILEEKTNMLYVSTKTKVLKFDLNWEKMKLVAQKSFKEYISSAQHFHITNIKQDLQENIWVTTFGGGVIKYNFNKNSAQHYSHSKKNYSLSSNIVNDILLEDSGVVWFATGHGGISILNPHKKLFHKLQNSVSQEEVSLKSNLTNNLLIDSKNRLWVVHFMDGLSISNEPFSLENVDHLTFRKELENLNVTGICELNGQIFIANDKGVSVYDLDSGKFIHARNVPNKSQYIETIAEVDGDIILSSLRKVYRLRLNGKKVRKQEDLVYEEFDEKLKLGSNVNHFYNDSETNLLFGTNHGLIQYDKKTKQFTTFLSDRNDDNSLGGNKIFCIYRSETGVLWIGTFGGGLHRCIEKDGKIVGFDRITIKDGLPDNVVYSILEDKEGELWLTSDNGIVKYNPTTKAVKVYNTQDGLSTNNFRKSSYYKDQYGSLLMGSLKGLVVFNPLEIQNNPFTPNPQILKLKIRNQEILPQQKYEGKILLTEPIYKTASITLPYDMNQVTLELGAMNPEGINNTKFAYRLKGVDKNWMYTETNQRHANYIKLPLGSYTFELKSYNSDGVESDKVKTLEIIIERPWYASYLAYLIYFVILALIVFSVTKYLTNMIRLRQKVLAEQKDKEHIKEINEAKLKFFTNISHELRTPLTLILSPLEKLAYDERLHPDLKSFVDNININGQRLMSLTNSLIDFRKVGQGEMKLKPIQQNIIPFIRKTAEAFEDYAQDKNINYEIDIDDEMINGWFDKAAIERIMFNLLSNAFKYTPKGGDVKIAVFQDGQELKMRVEDTGIGIKEEEIDRIFERFFNGNNEDTVFGSSGIGLYLVKELLDLHGGQISVESSPAQGTTFDVVIPTKVAEEIKEDLPQENTITKEKEKEPEQIVTINNKPKIMVVDDSLEIRELIHQLFSDKYQVFDAEDGIDGYEKVGKILPDVLLLDINMPNMNGYELAEKLKANVNTNHIPIIFLTALVDFESRKQALEKGGQLHIGKPFSPYMLELQVNNLLSQKSNETEKLKKKIIMSPDKEEVLTKDETLLKQIKDLLEENYADDQFNIEKIADALNMSYIQFYRKFKQITGANSNEYLREYRLKKAAHLLEHDHSLSVREVMFSVGFTSPSYFTKAFKKQFNITPASFKKQYKQVAD
ncbi:ATP-binding protein [Flammeovirga aprica]|uniref:histidine kinase n=1 Tax=Flammeovirga aprica JL-4 TaxID=694437 RepID=A0A7X9RU41_9BACT|nr:ATP-binding protein [Flammeovirga aprica]NME68719.1 helix-turn-helix domain-containing protein [Flammeovirga aprica JL-4]